MKKLLIIIALLHFTFLNKTIAQINLNDDLMVTYNVTFKPYLHKPYIEWKRTFKLLIQTNHSIFADEPMMKVYQSDRKSASTTDQYYTNIDFSTIVIEKSGNQVIHKQLIIDDIFIALQEKPFKEKQWKISTEITEIDGFQSQKATCTFGGREWTAWFTPEIPINNGPYKFGGLPGLILKVASEDGDYIMTFAGIENIESDSYNPDQVMYKILKKKNFEKIYQSLKDNPIEARKRFSPKEYVIGMANKTNEEATLELMIQASNNNAIERGF